MSILDKVVTTEERSLLCTYEKADIHIFFHVLSLENQSNVVIRAADRLPDNSNWVLQKARSIFENVAGG